jgi:glycosyltransferase involved in cell wall biosynthesis
MAPSPRSKVVEYTHAADIMLVILRESDFFMSAIPSKFFDGMAAGKPVVSNVDGELREIMERNNAGLYFSLREKGSFRKAIQSLGADSGLRQRMGENGRSLTRERFLRSEISREAIKEVEHRFGSEDHPARQRT